ncbi:hypothetical protein TL16_g01193 [Triparma laevis f. inornata]|uniref:Cyclic nucleotide-binding domain-containing protein n=1 Tax=Triparma laevis f. inornata TaxID=1714386 RepID=A0A9W6ZDD4_9STRA|nr:hypothetical protein TL16_g01193 [Triparma laevis f. inornata]
MMRQEPNRHTHHHGHHGRQTHFHGGHGGISRGNSGYSLAQRLSSRNIVGLGEIDSNSPTPGSPTNDADFGGDPQLVIDYDEDDEDEFVPRYIPAGGAANLDPVALDDDEVEDDDEVDNDDEADWRPVQPALADVTAVLAMKTKLLEGAKLDLKNDLNDQISQLKEGSKETAIIPSSSRGPSPRSSIDGKRETVPNYTSPAEEVDKSELKNSPNSPKVTRFDSRGDPKVDPITGNAVSGVVPNVSAKFPAVFAGTRGPSLMEGKSPVATKGKLGAGGVSPKGSPKNKEDPNSPTPGGAAGERRGSERGKANWGKLRVSHKVGVALKGVTEDLKMYGVRNDNDEDTDWNAIHSQNLENVPKYIIFPNGSFRVSWDGYVGILLLFIAVYVPYRITFLQALSPTWKWVEHIIDMSFGVDIVLNFFTAFHPNEAEADLCWDLKKIAKKYGKSYFLIDFVATFPFDLLISTDNADSGVNRSAKLANLGKGMKLLRGLKLLRVYRLQKFIREVEHNYNVHHGVSRMFNIIMVVLLATHLVGCVWYFLGIEGDLSQVEVSCTYEQDILDDMAELTDGGWVCREGLLMIDNNNGHRYIASLYWAFSTLTTVGYGDISAKTIGEQLFSMLMMMLGVSWYAYIVGSMSTIMTSFDRQNKQVREKMESVNIFVRDAKLPATLAKKVRNFFEYSIQRRNNGLFSYDADEILSELSAALKNEIITHVERDLIERIPFFKEKSLSFIADCIQLMQPMVVHENDFIIKEGAAADEMYFLIKGRAAVFYGAKKVKALVEGSYFGEIGCIMGGIRRAGIKAITTCELQCLNRRNLNNLLGEYPEVGDELKGIAKRRMHQVRVTTRQKNVTSIKKLLEARQKKKERGEHIPGQQRLSETIAEGDEEDEDEEGGVDGSLKKGLGSGPIKRGQMGGNRQLSMTTANVSGTHKVVDSATLHKINSGEDDHKEAEGEGEGDSMGCGDSGGGKYLADEKALQEEVNRLVAEKLEVLTDSIMTTVEANMMIMLEKASKSMVK